MLKSISFLLVFISSTGQSTALSEHERWAGGSEQHERALAGQISNAFLELQSKIAQHPASRGRRLRGTHAKGICLSGNLRVFNDDQLSAQSQRQIAQLRHSVFGFAGETLPARFRFANADSKIAADTAPDVRALSVAAHLPNGREQHFAFNNSPRFQIKDLQVFADLMKMAVMMANGDNPLWAFGKLTADVGTQRAFAVKAAADMGNEDKVVVPSYTSQSYWSGSAFALGENRGFENVVKIGSFPCSTTTVSHTRFLRNPRLSTDQTRGLAANYLSQGVREQVQNQKSICQTLFVQFLSETEQLADTNPAALIENPSLVWTGPIHPVAELQMDQVLPQETCDDPVNGINPSSVQWDLSGLGQINRARTLAEEASRQQRR